MFLFCIHSFSAFTFRTKTLIFDAGFPNEIVKSHLGYDSFFIIFKFSCVAYLCEAFFQKPLNATNVHFHIFYRHKSNVNPTTEPFFVGF